MTDGSAPLKKPKWEKFAQLVAIGAGVEEAYEKAGFKPEKRNAFRLKERPEVQARIDHLKTTDAQNGVKTVSEIVSRVALSREWVLDRLALNAEQALGLRPTKLRVRVKMAKEPDSGPVLQDIEITEIDRAAANKALELLGREVGLFKTDTDTPPVDSKPPTAVGDPQVAAALKRIDGMTDNLVAFTGGKKR